MLRITKGFLPTLVRLPGSLHWAPLTNCRSRPVRFSLAGVCSVTLSLTLWKPLSRL